MDKKSVSASQEDYLEAIYQLGQGGKPVRVTDLAEELNVSKASVNKAVSLLKEADMVEHEHYGTITLTQTGTNRAKEVFLWHSTLKRFLTQVLGVDEETAEEDACKMEHAISQETMDKLIAHLDGIRK